MLEVKEFETGDHCFGDILRVNGIEYDDLDHDEVIEFIIDRFKNDVNNSSLIKETFKNCLEHLQFDILESSSSKCDQCGNWNSYYKQGIEK